MAGGSWRRKRMTLGRRTQMATGEIEMKQRVKEKEKGVTRMMERRLTAARGRIGDEACGNVKQI